MAHGPYCTKRDGDWICGGECPENQRNFVIPPTSPGADSTAAVKRRAWTLEEQIRRILPHAIDSGTGVAVHMVSSGWLVEIADELRDRADTEQTLSRTVCEQADEVEALRAALLRSQQETSEARTLVAEANNSLYGSQGYFHSLNGGPFNPHHLADGIERLKKDARLRTAAEAERDALAVAERDYRVKWTEGEVRRIKLERERDALATALRELADLVDAIREGEYTPDSFTTQPARRLLNPNPTPSHE